MAKKKSIIKDVLKFMDDLSPSKQNPNISKATMKKRNAAKRKKKSGLF